MKYCSKCGHPLADYMRFCTRCGTKAENVDHLLQDMPKQVPMSQYCIEKCEFFNYCYGYRENCIVQSLEKMFSMLTPQEEVVIKLRFGLMSEPGVIPTLSEIGNLFNLSGERIRQIESKALRKLRHTSRLEVVKRHMYGALLGDNQKYAKLVCAILGCDLKEDIEVGVDFSIVSKTVYPQHKSVEYINNELSRHIDELPFLCKYADRTNKLKIYSLAQLLYAPFVMLLNEFNDIEVWQIKRILSKEGYKFKGDYYNKDSLSSILTDKLKEAIMDLEYDTGDEFSFNLDYFTRWLIENCYSVNIFFKNI